jgi:hypothetical protein
MFAQKRWEGCKWQKKVNFICHLQTPQPPNLFGLGAPASVRGGLSEHEADSWKFFSAFSASLVPRQRDGW